MVLEVRGWKDVPALYSGLVKVAPAHRQWMDFVCLKNGLVHGNEKEAPSAITYNSTIRIMNCQWAIEGKLHRDNGPAYIVFNGVSNTITEGWYQNGEVHNTKGSAWTIRYNSRTPHWQRGLPGPRTHRQFFVNNTPVTFAAFELLYMMLHGKPYEGEKN